MSLVKEELLHSEQKPPPTQWFKRARNKKTKASHSLASSQGALRLESDAKGAGSAGLRGQDGFSDFERLCDVGRNVKSLD